MKRKLWLITLLLALATFLTISQAYGLFETTGSGKANVDVSKWVINLNNIDISTGITDNFTITNISYSDNANIADGYVAPGRTGYFDITINPSGTEVAVRYDIAIDLTDLAYADNIAFSVTDLSGGNAVLTGVNTYSGVITLDQINANSTITLRLNISWTDDGNHDSSDTELGTTGNAKIAIPVSIDIKQYLGEEIVPLP